MMVDNVYAFNEIVVLSPLLEASIAGSTAGSWFRRILGQYDDRAACPDQVHYSTIHIFEGLEAPRCCGDQP